MNAVKFVLEVGTYSFFGLIFFFFFTGNAEFLLVSIVTGVMFAVAYMSYMLVKIRHELKSRDEEIDMIYQKFLKWLKDVEGNDEERKRA